MTDKYEEFKKWFIESDWVNCEVIIKKLPTNGGNAHLIYPNKKSIFENFEKEQAKKEKEKEIKKVLDKYIVKIRFGSINGDDIEINGDAVDKCYNELKEKDLIK